MMKLMLYTCLTFFIYPIYGQLIENRLNIGFGVNTMIPLNAKYVSENNFKYPSYWGNSGSSVGGNIDAEYKLSDYLSIGINSSFSHHLWWNDNVNNFTLSEPISKTSIVSCGIIYFPFGNRWNSKISNLGIFISPMLFDHKLSWNDLNVDVGSNTEKLRNSFSKSNQNIGIQSGVSFLRERNNWDGIRLNIYYHWVKDSNNFYLDRSFQSFNISLIYYIKFLKNKYYLYD